LGTPIFERLPRGMRLTAAGELFLQYIRERGAALEQVRSAIEDLKGLRRGRIRLIASQATAPVFLPAALASFRRRHPLVDFEVQIGDRLRAIAALRSYESDLALTFGLDADPDIEALASFEQRLMLLMHRDHPLARAGGPVRLRQCVDYPIVLANPDVGGRQLLDRFLARSSLRLSPVIESNSFEFLRGYLLHDQAITFQIALGAVSDGGQLVARDIEDRGFPRGQMVRLPSICVSASPPPLRVSENTTRPISDQSAATGARTAPARSSSAATASARSSRQGAVMI
jgi:DNA-binding transcriptional LysR family regulator